MGKISKTLANIVGFELLKCPGFWLGLDSASATLDFRFEVVTHGSEGPNRWVTHLQGFKDTAYDREYTSIFDRLPLDSVFSLIQRFLMFHRVLLVRSISSLREKYTAQLLEQHWTI